MRIPSRRPHHSWSWTGAACAGFLALAVPALLAPNSSGAAPARAASHPSSPASLVLDGQVKHPLRLAADELRPLPATRLDISFQGEHGVEKATYTGTLLWILLKRAGGLDAAGKREDLRHTMTITGRDGYAVVLALGEIDPDFGGRAAMIAYARDGRPIGAGELRLVIPGDKHGGRDVRDVVRIEVR